MQNVTSISILVPAPGFPDDILNLELILHIYFYLSELYMFFIIVFLYFH
jgi:hypothetical protein